MWHYFWGHITYHLMRMNSLHVRKTLLTPVLIILGIISAGPQLYVITLQDLYITRCPFPFSTLMLISIVLTVFMLGFVVVFSFSEEVCRVVKVLFHVFGVADSAYDVVYVYYVYRGYVCILSAREVYAVCVFIAVCRALTFVFFIFLIPYWIKEHCRGERQTKSGTNTNCERFSNSTSIPCFKPVM